MDAANPSILYRAHRLRFAIAALFVLPMTAGLLALGDVALTEGGVRNAALIPVLLAVLAYLDFVVVVKLIWPPEVELRSTGMRWLNYVMPGSGDYGWADLEGPEEGRGAHGIPLLAMRLKANGRTLRCAPSHFGATYAEMAAVIEAARMDRLIDPLQWRVAHPRNRFPHWLLDWGLPMLVAVIVVAGLAWLGVLGR